MQRLRRLLAFCLVILLEGYNNYSGGLFKCGVVAEEAAAPTITTGYPQCWIRKAQWTILNQDSANFYNSLSAATQGPLSDKMKFATYRGLQKYI